MTDLTDTSANTIEPIDAVDATSAPALDGSVDALVANLRVAREQLAALLAGANKVAEVAAVNAPESDRSAA